MIADMINELQATNSSPHKVSILKRYDTPGIRQILGCAYNPYFVYGLGKTSLEDSSVHELENRDTLANIEQTALSQLINRELSGSKAATTINDICSMWGSLLYYIITKDLRCGISATTINKAFPGLIPTFKVQLAKEVPYSKLQYPLSAEVKYDGVRILAIVSDTIELRTRNGKLVDLPRLKDELKALPEGVYDGELIYTPTGTNESRTSVSGLVNSAIHGGKVNETALWLMVFDNLTLTEFKNCKSNTPYIVRRRQLDNIWEDYNIDSDYLICTGRTIIHNAKDAEQAVNLAITNGQEGLILKDLNGKYEFKRSKAWAKFKAIKTADLVCTDYEEGTGKYEGAIGALYLEGRVEGKYIQVFVGSGLSDSDRNKPFEYYKNKTVEVKYNEIIPGHKSGYTLFLPRFVEVRIDK